MRPCSHFWRKRGGAGASKMNWLLTALTVCVLVPSAYCASGSVDWCYHQPGCNDTTWPTIVPQFCNGSRQSPINIISAQAEPDDNLTAFTFNNFSSTTAMKKIENTGRTVKVALDTGVSISGGGLSESYESLQFHLHWGNTSSVPGSEHTVDGKQYPMELHIVNIKASHNGNTTAGFADSTGFAALGFLIEVLPGNETNQPASWHNLTSYLASIRNGGDSVSIAPGISLNDLLVGVNFTQYYRYLGSLTTPTCNEAVVWTVFKTPIQVSRNLIDLFSTTVHFANSSSSPLMTLVYRDVQPAQPVTTQRASSGSGSNSASKTIYSLGLMALSLALGRN